MCGLAGIFQLDGQKFDAGDLTAMNRTLVHRGPDDHHQICLDMAADNPGKPLPPGQGGHLGLAGRRLAIIDLSRGGRMPMSNADQTLWLVYNGEIYNYREIRSQLEHVGRRFRTATDTEVILQAYETWGLDACKRFNGMWALALYDTTSGRLTLSRDRFGIKPLYYFFNGDVLVFGSEIKALLAHPVIRPRPDLEALYNYLARSYRFVDGRRDENGAVRTFFQKIRQVPPAHHLIVDRDGLSFHRYWALNPNHRTLFENERDYALRFLELLQDSVHLRLRSDVPVAAQLSGGLDSSATTALAAQSLGIDFPVFSACYDITPFDEQEFIWPTVQQIKACWTRIFPRPDDLFSVLPTMIRAFDEPVCTVTFYAHWQVMSEVHRQGYKVILNGHGADELGAGYYDHFLHHFGDLKRQNRTGYLTDEIEAWLTYHGRRRRKQWVDYSGRIDKGIPYVEEYLKVFAPYENALGPRLWDITVNRNPDVAPYDSVLSNRLFNELTYETLPAVLKAEDRTTMAFSIESRLPFLDYRLVEYMFSIPNTMKIREGLNKYVQRQALRGVIPEMVRTRTEKVGFNAPSELWFRGPLKDQFEKALAGSTLFDRGLLNRPGFEAVRSEHQAGAANHYQFLWQVLNLDLWLKEYFG
jgi:asparagine synthase (glutamine-hydrolysing)